MAHLAISREPAPLLKKYIQFTVSFPDYGSCRELFQVVSSLLANSLLGRSKRARGTRRDTRPLAAHFARPNRTACSHATGADPGFFLGGGALVSCSISTPINHIFFFGRIPVVLENRRSFKGGGGCAHPQHPPPRFAPVLNGFRL